jgi:glycosyltransferase involved in cell wall biosynthesis
MYSKISDFSLRHALLLSYPKAAINELAITRRVKYWVKRADVIMPFFQMDGIGRWDVLPFSAVTIDAKDWTCKSTYSDHDGINGIVKVVHTPNHRGFKGTEFLIEAVDDLRSEGLLVELILVEGKPNSEVKRIMHEDADILAEQFIVTAYALSAIEGMASGLPVLANLENESYTQIFRRYSYLNECPILSTSPENIKNNLRALVTSPKLRRELGFAGRKFVEKYHSDEFAEYIFKSIYENIYYHKNIDLMNLFHPLKSKYRLSKPLIKSPLIKNKLP